MNCLTVSVLVQAAAAGHAEVAPHVLGRFKVKVLSNPTLHYLIQQYPKKSVNNVFSYFPLNSMPANCFINLKLKLWISVRHSKISKFG